MGGLLFFCDCLFYPAACFYFDFIGCPVSKFRGFRYYGFLPLFCIIMFAFFLFLFLVIFVNWLFVGVCIFLGLRDCIGNGVFVYAKGWLGFVDIYLYD